MMFFKVLFCLALGQVLAKPANTGNDPCKRQCSTNLKQVCGSDGKTYTNLCRLAYLVKCNKYRVVLVGNDACPETDTPSADLDGVKIGLGPGGVRLGVPMGGMHGGIPSGMPDIGMPGDDDFSEPPSREYFPSGGQAQEVKLTDEDIFVHGQITNVHAGDLNKGSCITVQLLDVSIMDSASFELGSETYKVTSEDEVFDYMLAVKKPIEEELSWRTFAVSVTINNGWCKKKDAPPSAAWVKAGDYLTTTQHAIKLTKSANMYEKNIDVECFECNDTPREFEDFKDVDLDELLPPWEAEKAAFTTTEDVPDEFPDNLPEGDDLPDSLPEDADVDVDVDVDATDAMDDDSTDAGPTDAFPGDMRK